MVVDLELEALDVARALARRARRRRDTAPRGGARGPPTASVAQVLVERRRRRASGSPAAAPCPASSVEVAALGDLDACWRAPPARRRTAPPSRACVLKYCSRREARAAGAGRPSDVAFGDADARLVRAEVLAVAGTAPDASRPPAAAAPPASATRGVARSALVVGPAGALQFDVEAMRETASASRARRGRAPSALPCSERLADVAVARARQRDQPVACPRRATRRRSSARPRCWFVESTRASAVRTG